MSCKTHNIAVIKMHHDAKMCVSLLVRVTTMTLNSDTFCLREVQQGMSEYRHMSLHYNCIKQTSYKYKCVA